MPGQLLILAGRRWRVIDVDAKRREALVKPAGGGNPPKFEGGDRSPSGGVVSEMRRVYEELDMPGFLDPAAVELLTEARTSFDRLGLRHSQVVREAGQILLFPWVGEAQQNALRLALTRAGLSVEATAIALAVPAEEEGVLFECLNGMANSDAPDAQELAMLAGPPPLEKFDAYLGEDLLAEAYASEHLNVPELPALARALLRSNA